MISPEKIYNFCTIFDYSYFAKGLALYNSLDKTCKCNFYVFTPDLKCKKVLLDKKYSNLTVIDFSEIEGEDLLRVKPQRDIAEYFWTIKGPCIEYLFNKFDHDIITYIDADTYFYSSPEPILEEIENNSVLILPHNFSPQYKHEIKNGTFNAGFISFKNDQNGKAALKWWKDRSIEWCYRKKENGRFGDQMYLNELKNFPGVHSIRHLGGLANWNVQQYKFEKEDDNIIGITYTGERFRVLFYHFHYMKFLFPQKVELGRKLITKSVLDIFYKPYIKYLFKIAPVEAQGFTKNKINWKTPIIYLLRKVKKTYNIFPINEL